MAHVLCRRTGSHFAGTCASETHRRYTGFINARLRATGHLFQGRFGSVPMDEERVVAAARYVALNPVRAGLVARAQDWEWSSSGAHLAGRDDVLVRVAPLIERAGALDLIGIEPDPTAITRLRSGEATGCPLGSHEFATQLEQLTRRRLRRQRPGPKGTPQEDARQLDLLRDPS